ncbi:MAG: sigma-70 family RNA polymerase sigma factor [Deltaproteobacteria bacterium]|nr:sigma-70 family RNA polymerase sigma factor [Deltaproteobacteria bacterium]
MELVYRTYIPLIHTVCTQGFGGFRGFFDPVDRDDAMQTIFAAAFEERARLAYNGVDPYAGFLRGIAHNTIRRMLSSRKRFDRRPEAPEPVGEDAEARVLEAETAEVICAFRDTITDPRERAILQRYFCDGCAEEALAAELGITRYRLRKIVARLHRTMRRHLEAHGITGC